MAKLTYKPYKRKLKIPIKMSRGVITNRLGVVVRIDGVFGEAVIMDYFGTETLEQSLSFLKSLPKNIDESIIEDIPHYATRCAIESAFISHSLVPARDNMSLTKLLPAGNLALEKIKNFYNLGFRSFKWKIGIYENETEILNDLLGFSGVSLRLDANAGLSLEQAKRWLEFCENKPIEFIEQPLAVEKIQDMIFLSKQYTTPIALDESVSRFEDLKKIQEWQGYVVVKPLRLGMYREFFKWRDLVKNKIVYSSALESAFGESFALRIAASDKENNFSLGFGVRGFFEEDGMSLLGDTSVVDVKKSIQNAYSQKLNKLWEEI